MSYAPLLQNVLVYIDGHLDENLNVESLAKLAGFSQYHFSRVFPFYTGFAVMEYVRIRRLTHAAAALSKGWSRRKNRSAARPGNQGDRLIDIALAYGFETHSGFSKAFKRYFGTSPELYRTRCIQTVPPPIPDLLRMYEQYSIGGIVMEPKFITKEAIHLAGYALRTKDDGSNTVEIPQFWTKYLTDGHCQKLHSQSFVKHHAEYGACCQQDAETGVFDYVIGVEVTDGVEAPAEFHTYTLAPATYAVFTTPPSPMDTFSPTIQGTWRFIMQEWFPQSGYEYANGCTDFEYYDNKGATDNMVCEIYIPVQKR